MFYQISLTSSNGMANGWKSLYSSLWDLRSCTSLSARTVLPIKSSSALSSPPLQECKSKAPKGPLNPQLLICDQADEPPPYRPGDETSRGETPPQPFFLQIREAMTPNPQRDFLSLHRPGPKANTCFLAREVTGQEGAYMGSCGFLNF